MAAAATDDQHAAVRRWVGADETDPTRTTIDAWIEREGTTDKAALAILQTRRASILTGPSSWSASGDYSENWRDTLAALDDLIGQLEAVVAAADLAAGVALPDSPVGCLTRGDRPDLWPTGGDRWAASVE